MKKLGIAKICMAACLALGLTVIPVNQLTVQADDGTMSVKGDVSSGTTADLLVLSTDEGTMKIKLDDDTDTGDCKILLPGREIYVSVKHGSDKYLHAVKITGDKQITNATVDNKSTFTLTGKINKITDENVIYFDTEQGIMQIKLDPSTDLTNISVLVADKTYTLICARGSDAYLHAISISDGKNRSGSDSAMTPDNIATRDISGTVHEKTKEKLLYLSTDEGVMQFKIDSNADTKKGMVLTPGNKLTVSFYHGDDSYLHAAVIEGKKKSSSATINTSATMTVEGSVDDNSDENMLYLNTSDGRMELKLDAVDSLNDCNVLVEDMDLVVKCAHGSDGYWHAVDITAD